MLSERKKQILKAIVDDYVVSAEPVGSKRLMARHHLGVSSATIRNDMAELEDEGYLEKPYTSAGRVPSDKGYRAYVDDLLDLTPGRELMANAAFAARVNAGVLELSALLREAASALADATTYVSLVVSPPYTDSVLRQVRLIMIEPGKALVVVVLEAGVVKDRVAHVPCELNGDTLEAIGRALEAHLVGMKVSDVTLVAVQAAMANQPISDAWLERLSYEAYVSIKDTERLDVFIEGTHRLLDQPEYQNVDKARRFLHALGDKRVVAGYLSDLGTTSDEPDGRYIVRIGQEIGLDGFEDTSFVTSVCVVDGTRYGQIGILGPRRMNYGHIIAQVRFMNRVIQGAATKTDERDTTRASRRPSATTERSL